MKHNKTRLVRKTWSNNPVKFKEIRLDVASKKYQEYLTNYHRFRDSTNNVNAVLQFNHDFSVKTFIDWLETEI